MTNQEGIVQGIFDKDWQSIKLWSFKLEGSDRFWRLGRDKPEFKEGDFIKFSERNSNVDPKSIEVLGTAGTTSTSDAPSDAPQPTAQSGSGSAVSAQSAKDVGERIRFQQARRDATNIIVAALHTDALPWASNTAKSKKLDLLVEYVKQVTNMLLEIEG